MSDLRPEDLAYLIALEEESFRHSTTRRKSPERDRLQKRGLIKKGRPAKCGNSWTWFPTEAGMAIVKAARP